ncbi:ATP-binding protein [Nocardioides sp. CPCC 206347]|uniref:ATP-binding protein n=1 Tax=unclassified Nocardioides TaxID=2615069 RepID=UPI003622DF97
MAASMGGRLVGREPALAVAVGALDEALAGAGRLLLVTGDPGIGKTALVREVGAIARGRGARVIWTSCPPGGGAPAYWPWSQVVRALDEDAHRALTLLEGGSGVVAADDATARFELHESVIGALATLAGETGAVMVLDDLHWADQPSLELLDVAARQIGGQRLLIIGTYRDVEAPATLDRLAANAEGITLGGLDSEAVTGLVTTITGTAPGQLDADVLRSRTAGNPLFVRELARLMVARGTGATDSRALPATVTETLRQRLTPLTGTCRELLGVVAVADTTDPALLHRATGVPGPEIARLLTEARMARVLVEEGPEPDRPFVHDLYREAVLAELTAEDRRARHGTVAEAWIELTAADGAAPAGRIAAHLAAAVPETPTAHDDHRAQLAVAWLSRAAAEATTRLGHEEAVRLHRRALELSAGPDPRLLLSVAEAELRAGDPAARGSFLTAAAGARAVGDVDALTAAALGLHQVGARGDHDTQVGLLEEATEAVESGTPERALLLAALAREHRHANGPAEEWQHTAEAAVRAARELTDNPRVLATCLLALHDAMWNAGTAGARLPVVAEMAEAAVAAGDTELAAQARVLRAACLLETNDRRGLVELAHYCREEEYLGHARGRWEALSRSATLRLITGAVDEAREASAAAYALGTRIGIPDAAGVHGTLQWPLSLFTGERLALLETMNQIDLIPMRDAFTAAVLRTEGDPEEARRIAQTLSLDVLPVDKYDLEFEALAAEALAVGGHTTEAERSYLQLLPYAGTNVVVGGCASFWGPVDLYLGHLALALDDADAARRHYDAAATMAAALGAPRWQQHAAGLRESIEVASSDIPRFVRSGEVWTLTWQGRSAHLPDSKGIRDLACLVGRRGQDVAATELMSGRPTSGADPVLDAQAKASYRRRLEELEEEIDDAAVAGDLGRAERARDERAALVDELAAAVGLGGRDRRLGDDAERARKAVTSRIRDAVRRVTDLDPELGDHLAGAVQTGAWCAYRPG